MWQLWLVVQRGFNDNDESEDRDNDDDLDEGVVDDAGEDVDDVEDGEGH